LAGLLQLACVAGLAKLGTRGPKSSRALKAEDWAKGA